MNSQSRRSRKILKLITENNSTKGQARGDCTTKGGDYKISNSTSVTKSSVQATDFEIKQKDDYLSAIASTSYSNRCYITSINSDDLFNSSTLNNLSETKASRSVENQENIPLYGGDNDDLGNKNRHDVSFFDLTLNTSSNHAQIKNISKLLDTDDSYYFMPNLIDSALNMTELNFSNKNLQNLNSSTIIINSSKPVPEGVEFTPTLHNSTIVSKTAHVDESLAETVQCISDPNSNTNLEIISKNFSKVLNANQLRGNQDPDKNKITILSDVILPNYTFKEQKLNTSPIINKTDVSGSDQEYVPSSSDQSSSKEYNISNESLDGSRLVDFDEISEKSLKENGGVTFKDTKQVEDETIKENVETSEEMSKRKRDRDFCFYCETLILNFSRHMVRHHLAEPEVQKALSFPKNSVNRKKIFTELRKKGNYITNSQSLFKPMKKCKFSDKTDYLPCSKCLGFYSKKQLWRHVKKCDNTIPTSNIQVQAQNFLIRYVKVDKNLIEKVFPRMKADKISLVAKKDKLICMFGAQYMSTHREVHFETVISRKMRELAKLLIEIKNLKPEINNFEDILKPQFYDTIVKATKIVARYNDTTRGFDAPTYAMNISTSIKQCCSIALLQSYKTEASIDTAHVQGELKMLSKLIQENWKYDISSRAADDLNIKKWNKITMVPLATDLKLLKDYLCKVSKESIDILIQCQEKTDIKAFNNLIECTYCRVLLLNRRRPGELQRLKLNDYNEHGNKRHKYEEFDKVLSSTEKILVKNFKRIVIRGKRGKGVPVLFSNEIQKYIKYILSIRQMYINKDNNLLFAKAGGVTVCGYKILEKYSKACGAKNYKALTSTRLRRHLATMTQLFVMTESELEQLATFMGHTLSVHKDNYRLPSDVYQTAKIAKLLLLMEDGKADIYQGKTLNDINLSMDEEIEGNEIENQEVVDFELQDDNSMQNINLSSPQPVPSQESSVKFAVKTKRTLVPWTIEQKNVVTNYFKEHIKHKKPPKRAECDELKNIYTTLLQNKDWLKIKVFIQNIYKKTLKR